MARELSVDGRASLHAALGDPTRVAVVDALLLGDVSPGRLARELAIGSNLMAHHVKVLESVGLVTRMRSEADRRRSYLHLDPTVLTGLVPTLSLTAPRVVFVCTHNSARSQLAAAVWPRHSDVPATSACTRPARRVHPRAVTTARRQGLRMGRVRPTAVAEVLTDRDLVVTVCDNAREELEQALVGRVEPTLHWSIPDPCTPDTDEAFEAAYRSVASRIGSLAPAVRPDDGAPDR